jgi:hypothetical protein
MKFYYLDGHLPVRILAEELDCFVIEKSNKTLEFVEKNRVQEEPVSSGNTLGYIKLPKSFEPKFGEDYFRASEDLTKAIKVTFNNSKTERLRVKFGLCFQTEIEALAYLAALEFAERFKPTV